MTLIRSLANLGRRLFLGLVLALLAVAIPTTNIGCAAAGSLVVPTVTCFGQTISQQDVKRAVADLWAHNWSDLEALAQQDHYGWPVLACIIKAATEQNQQLNGPAAEFRRLHAVEFRAAESAASRCPSKPYTVAFSPPAPAAAAKGGDRR